MHFHSVLHCYHGQILICTWSLFLSGLTWTVFSPGTDTWRRTGEHLPRTWSRCGDRRSWIHWSPPQSPVIRYNIVTFHCMINKWCKHVSTDNFFKMNIINVWYMYMYRYNIITCTESVKLYHSTCTCVIPKWCKCVLKNHLGPESPCWKDYIGNEPILASIKFLGNSWNNFEV